MSEILLITAAAVGGGACLCWKISWTGCQLTAGQDVHYVNISKALVTDYLIIDSYEITCQSNSSLGTALTLNQLLTDLLRCGLTRKKCMSHPKDDISGSAAWNVVFCNRPSWIQLCSGSAGKMGLCHMPWHSYLRPKTEQRQHRKNCMWEKQFCCFLGLQEQKTC